MSFMVQFKELVMEDNVEIVCVCEREAFCFTSIVWCHALSSRVLLNSSSHCSPLKGKKQTNKKHRKHRRGKRNSGFVVELQGSIKELADQYLSPYL